MSVSSDSGCVGVECLNEGVCVEGLCQCTGGFTGTVCDRSIEVSKGAAVVGGVVVALFVAVVLMVFFASRRARRGAPFFATLLSLVVLGGACEVARVCVGGCANIPHARRLMGNIWCVPETAPVFLLGADVAGPAPYYYLGTYAGGDSVSARAEVQTCSVYWGLDILDGTRDSLFYVNGTGGNGRHLFVVDSGVWASSVFFGNRVSGLWDFESGTAKGAEYDVNGHGTHVASLAASSIHGPAKHVSIHSVRVLNEDGNGNVADIIEGLSRVLDYAETHEIPPDNITVVMSLGTKGGRNTALEVATMTVAETGISVVVAAGNDNEDACLTSPSAVQHVNVAVVAALTLVSPSAVTYHDAVDIAYYSNTGDCVTVAAPGTGMYGASGKGPYTNSEAVMSGTSQAAGLMAGIVAAAGGVVAAQQDEIPASGGLPPLGAVYVAQPSLLASAQPESKSSCFPSGSSKSTTPPPSSSSSSGLESPVPSLLAVACMVCSVALFWVEE